MARFEKWEGLGNDFVLVEAGALGGGTEPGCPSAEVVRKLCDRRRGVGADGVLVVERGEDDAAAAGRMTIFNADGSRAEMCGNGLRCVAAYLAAVRSSTESELVIATDAGLRRCELGESQGSVFVVEVTMGRARLGGTLRFGDQGQRYELCAVDVGNPHAVGFAAAPHDALDTLGPQVDRAIEGGSNVELCEVQQGGRRLAVTVWERGVGRTLACGTGACAAAAVAVAQGRAPADLAIAVCLPGGELRVTVPSDGGELRLRGPARRVFSGQVDLTK